MSTDVTLEEMFESLTGFDDIAVNNKFGNDPVGLSQDKPMAAQRAMIFVHLRRQGSTDAQAYEAAMNMSMKDVVSYFIADEEIDPDDPETPSGKGALQPA